MTPGAHEIQGWIVQRLSVTLAIAAGDIDIDATFSELGLDSAAGVEMTGDIESWLQLELKPTLIYEYPNIRQLSRALGELARHSPLSSAAPRA